MKRATISVAVLSLLALLVLLPGCATVMSGTDQVMRITSEPRSAVVRVYDHRDKLVVEMETPTTVILPRKAQMYRRGSYRVEIQKEGYEPQVVELAGKVNVLYYIVGNIFLGNVIGWAVVDPISGAMWDLKPDSIAIDLEPTR